MFLYLQRDCEINKDTALSRSTRMHKQQTPVYFKLVNVKVLFLQGVT